MQDVNKHNIRIWTRMGQRGTVCGIALPELVHDREDVYVLTADLAQLSALAQVDKAKSNRLVNVGIAEQNMIGVAAGLAYEDNTVYATTYATFLSMRCYEQIRHCLGYQRANVKLIATTAGVAMGHSGNAHYALEDMAIMNAIPGMIVLSPADAIEAYQMAHLISNIDGPVYMRLTGNLYEPMVHGENYKLELGKADVLREGDDVAIVATGSLVAEAYSAANQLQEMGIETKVVDMHTIKPLDRNVLDDCLGTKFMVTVEEHNVIGGLGDIVSSYVATKASHPRVYKLGINDTFLNPGDYGYLKKAYRLDANGIKEAVCRFAKETM